MIKLLMRKVSKSYPDVLDVKGDPLFDLVSR